MAETKTNIPIEIKMGNAGAEGANLPAFKEGSIIFTKDTKKIYIDPVGETERIAVGGAEVDLSGKQDKFADVTNSGICKVAMSNSGTTFFCNNANDSGIFFDSNIKLYQGKGIKDDDDLVNKAYVDTKQVKFADYSETTDGIIYKNLTLGNNEALIIRGQNDNLAKITLEPFVVNIDSKQININPTDRFTIQNILEMITSEDGNIAQFSIGNSSETIGQIYFTDSNRFGTSGITLQGNIENVTTTGLNINKNNIKLISWTYGNNTNNAPLLGISTPVATADTTKGITADDIDYQAVNKKYVDDIKTELLKAINHPYTYDETTKELTLIL